MALTEEDKKFIADNLPPPYNTPDRYADYIQPRVQMHAALCTVAKAEVKKILSPLLQRHRHRFFYRIDDTHDLKSPAGIIDKIRRSRRPDAPAADRYDLTNFEKKMTDLARFRIVCNFLSDLNKVTDAVRNAPEITNDFNLKENSSIDQRPNKRKSGERSIKFILEYKKNPGLFLEIQFMTQLQEAWDKKDHFLIYELRRRSPGQDEKNFPDFLDAKMFAMAELLYIADNYFEELRGAREPDMLNEENP